MTKSGFNFLTTGVLLCSVTVAQAQTTNAPANAHPSPAAPWATPKVSDAPAKAEETSAYKQFTVGAEAGTPGFGGSASWRFADFFGVRGGFDYFSYSKTGNEIDGIKYNTELRLMSEPIGVDIYPWVKSSFRITVGIMLNQNELTGVAPRDPVFGNTFITINNTAYDSASIGDLNLTVKQQPVSPYVSVGYSYYFDKAKHWSVSGELGVAYTGNPDVTLTTGIPNSVPPQDLNAEAKQIEDTYSKYKFFPILRLGVNYSF